MFKFKNRILVFVITIVLIIITICLDFLAVDLSVKTNDFLFSLINRDNFGYVMNVIFEKFNVFALFMVSIPYLMAGLMIVFYISHFLGKIFLAERKNINNGKMPIFIKMMMLFVIMFIITPNVNIVQNDILTIFYSSNLGKFVATIIETVIEVITSEFFYLDIKVIEDLLVEVPLVLLMIPTFIVFYKISYKITAFTFDRFFNKEC